MKKAKSFIQNLQLIKCESDPCLRGGEGADYDSTWPLRKLFPTLGSYPTLSSSDAYLQDSLLF